MYLNVLMFIFIFISFLNKTKSVIVFNFEKKFNLANINESMLYDYFYNNDFISYISIGTPPQKVPLNINFEKHSFFILEKEKSGIYNKNLSSSYKLINQIKKRVFSEYFREGLESNETIILKNHNDKEIKIEESSFMIPIKEEKPNLKIPYGGIGLNFKSHVDIKYENFVYQMKDRNIINSYAFFLTFNEKNNSEGKLYIGSYPHQFNTKKYKENDFLYMSASYNNIGNPVFQVNFENYEIFGNKYKMKSIDFNASFSGILGNRSFKKIIEQYFFKDLYEHNICKEVIINKAYTFIVCNEKCNVEKFGNFSFYSKQLNYSFVLSYNDLFKKEGDKYYFLIVFDTVFYEDFKMGEPFLRKYFIIFDQDRKIIGFYNINKNDDKKNTFVYIIIFILIGVCIILSAFLTKYVLYKPRKIRANELEDNYDYLPENPENYNIN